MVDLPVKIQVCYRVGLSSQGPAWFPSGYAGASRRVEAQEGGGVSLGIVLVQSETVIVGDLPPQAFAAGGEIGVLTYTP